MSEPSTGSAVPGQPAASEHPADGEPERSSNTDPATIERIAARTRPLVRERLQAVLDERTAQAPTPRSGSSVERDDELLDRIADEEAERADGPLLHVAVIHAVSEELGIELADALEHPAVQLTRERLRPNRGPAPDGAAAPDNGGAAPDVDAAPDNGAPTPDDGASLARQPRQRALLLDAVHVFGIETLEPGDQDIELRLADAGIDVRKRSTAAMIGRLRWNEVRSVAVQRPRRGLPGRRRPALFVAGTDQGEVTFELPGVSDEEITMYVDPLIARNCASYADSNAG